jgi:tetratricopeptide (TPR) repeat protein
MKLARVGLAVSILGIASSAAAEDKAAARQAYIQGSKYYDLNQYGEALEAFKRAYWNYEEPVFLYNIAQCHRALKHKAEAIDFYRSYLRKSPDAPNRADVQRMIADLERALAQERALAIAAPEGTLSESRPAPAHEATPAPNSAPAVTTTGTAPQRQPDKPLWKKPWLWGVVAASIVVVAGVAIGVGIAASSPSDPSPSFGTLKVN